MRQRQTSGGQVAVRNRESSGSRWAALATLGDRLGISTSQLRDALLIFAGSRVGFILLTLIALPNLHLGPIGSDAFLRAWGRLDALRYAAIADHGYAAGAQIDNTAFYPLMPLLMRLVSPLAGGNSVVAGLVVANLAYVVALLGIAVLAGRDYGEATGRRAMLYVTLFPSALFLFAGYTESLFLALAVWAFIALRRGWWWQAGVLGMGAALTRQVGLFLVLPFIYEHTSLAGWHLRKLRPSVLWALLIPTGLLLFMAWLWHSVGDPLAFARAQRFWFRQFAWPWNTFHRVLRELPHQTPTVLLVRGIVDVAAVLLIAGLIVYGARRWRAGDTLYVAALWVVAICYPSLYWPLLSDTRFMLAEIPCFLLLAYVGRRRWLHVSVLGVFGALLIVMTLYFFSTQQIL